VISATGGALNLGRTSTGTIFGTYGALNITSAIKFLSTFGHTNVTQNVSLKTLSGSAVAFQSGQEVPYVSGVSNNGSYSNNSSNNNNNNNNNYNNGSSTQTDKVETGLKLDLKPLYDGDSELVTIDVKVDLNQILQFVELSAGNQIGSLTQPLVQKQNLSDLVQVQAGRTVVIGGLQYDSDTFSGNEPSMIRDKLAELNRSIGKRSRETQRNALFIILRPAVTVYEAE
jgi:type II secretory pathway component GspD/PulD (secretin)